MILSCDDACRSDIRLAKLADKYNIDCVFYWPVEWHSLAHDNGYEPLRFEEAYKIAQDFEIGSHTITHRHLTKISLDEACYEIQESKDMLEYLFDIDITKFAPPRGYTNEQLTEFTLDIYETQRLTKGEGLVHIHPNSGANGNIHWLDYVKTHDIKEAWLHSWELDRYPGEWDNLELFLRDKLWEK